jgi:nicotinate phosphoribosyltransferase
MDDRAEHPGKKRYNFHVAEPRDILAGYVTDIYFKRSLEILRARGLNPLVRAEFIAKSLPAKSPWAVLAGLEETLELLRTLPVKVRAIAEGSVFRPWEPVLEVEGRYQDFCVYETALLGLLCQASGVATKAARFKALAGDRLVLSFGARRMHPAVAPMIERSAFVGGCDGISVVKAGEMIGQNPMGTMPHALILCFGSTLEAVRAYDEVLPPEVRRVALIDTFQDEKFECIAIADALGKRLHAVRFDTPSSRRGDFATLLRECRWELDIRGHRHVKFYVSGGIREEDLSNLNPVVDGYGVGTAISSAPVIDFSMDIVEVEGTPRAKRGKRSGSKRLLRCPACGERRVVPNRRKSYTCDCGRRFEDLLRPVLERGRMLTRPETALKIRKRALKEVEAAVGRSGLT